MSRRYLEDFMVGQTFGSGRLRVGTRLRSRLLPPNSIPSHSISTKTRRSTQSSAGWRQAAGIRRLSPCGFWSRARSHLQGASWAQDSMSSVGRGPCDLVMSSTSKVKVPSSFRGGTVGEPRHSPQKASISIQANQTVGLLQASASSPTLCRLTTSRLRCPAIQGIPRCG
jgi:hypothetical protein